MATGPVEQSALERPAERPFSWATRLLQMNGETPARLRLHTLAIMRWVAVAGQLFTILFVHFSLGIELPLMLLLPAVALTALINLLLARIFHLRARVPEGPALWLFTYDILQLGFLLALTGGLQNPFALLILLPLALAASTLGFRSTVIITVVAVSVTTILALIPTGLPWRGGSIELPALYVLSNWTALTMTAVMVAVFTRNTAEEARRQTEALYALQSAMARERALTALGSQAAAAAHHLGTPLGTINVIAKEIVNELPEDSPLMEEAQELLGQAKRCRDILATLRDQTNDPNEHRSFTRAPLSVHLEKLARDLARPGIDVSVQVRTSDEASEPTIGLSPEMRHAFANLIENAIEFARARVLIEIEASRIGLDIEILDDGEGFSPDVMDWLGEPYLSTRRDEGGLGLGVFIANTLLARTGASIHFSNANPGARVLVSWSVAGLEQMHRGENGW